MLSDKKKKKKQVKNTDIHSYVNITWKEDYQVEVVVSGMRLIFLTLLKYSYFTHNSLVYHYYFTVSQTT